MKTKLLPFLPLFFFTVVNLNAQTNCNALFQRTFSNNDTLLTPVQVVANDDESFIVAGTSTIRTNTDGHVYAYAAKSDKDGNLLWSKHYTVAGKNCYFQNIRSTADGGYICVGGIDLYNNGFHKSWLVKLDAAGTVQWNKEYADAVNVPGSAYLNFKDIRQTGTNGYAIIADLIVNSYIGIVLLKVNNIGDIQWSNSYILDSTFTYGSSRGIVVDGNVITATMQGPTNYAMQVNKNTGQFNWMKTFEFNTFNFSPTIREIYKSGNNYMISANSGGVVDYNQAVFYINKNGEPLKALKIAENLNLRNISIPGATALPTHDGGFITLKILSGSTTNLYINKFNSKGRVQWNKGFLSIATTLIKEMPDSGFVSVVPHISVFPGTGFRVIRMDKDGNSGGCINEGVSVTTTKIDFVAKDTTPSSITQYSMNVSSNSVIVSNVPVSIQTNQCYTACLNAISGVEEKNSLTIVNNNFKVYPNPVNDNMYVNFNAVAEDNYSITIMDATGKVHHRMNNKCVKGNNLISLQLKDLPTGSYFIQLNIGNSKAQATRFVKINK